MTYDENGNKATRTLPDSNVTTYTYDALNRLTSESDDGGLSVSRRITTSYVYDDTGNRLTKTVDSVTTTYTVDQLNRVFSMSSPSSSSSFTYDLNGNRATKNDGTVTHTCSYDRENRLVAVNDGSADIFSAVYDYRTRRISKLENGSTTNYVYDGGVNVQELDAARSLTKQLVRGTGMGGGIGSVLYTEDASASNREFFCYNAIGSVVALANSTGTVTSTSDYEAFGSVVATTGSTTETRKFCTKERDASIGLDNFGFRYYDAELGRFLTRDPIGYPDGPNNYLYCHNNPINFVDPLGLEKQDKKKQEEMRKKAVDEFNKKLKDDPEGKVYGPFVGKGIRKTYGEDAYDEKDDFGMLYSEEQKRWYRAEIKRDEFGNKKYAKPGVPELEIDSIKAASEDDYANAAYESYANADINAMDRKLADDHGAVESVKSAAKAEYAQDYKGASKEGSLLKQTLKDKWFEIAFAGAGAAFRKAKRAQKQAQKQLRTNKEFREFFHRSYKPKIAKSTGKTSNRNLDPSEILEAWEDFINQ